MLKEGDEKVAKYWGKFKVKKVARLTNPVKCYSNDIGEALFNPTLAKIEWEQSPSEDKNEIWFPYWITVRGKERYGQYAPMIGEGALLELFEDAIRQNFFSSNFLLKLDKLIKVKLPERCE